MLQLDLFSSSTDVQYSRPQKDSQCQSTCTGTRTRLPVIRPEPRTNDDQWREPLLPTAPAGKLEPESSGRGSSAAILTAWEWPSIRVLARSTSISLLSSSKTQIPPIPYPRPLYRRHKYRPAKLVPKSERRLRVCLGCGGSAFGQSASQLRTRLRSYMVRAG